MILALLQNGRKSINIMFGEKLQLLSASKDKIKVICIKHDSIWRLLVIVEEKWLMKAVNYIWFLLIYDFGWNLLNPTSAQKW